MDGGGVGAFFLGADVTLLWDRMNLWAMSMLPARIQRKSKVCFSWVRSITVAFGTWIWTTWELAWYNVLVCLLYIVQNSQQGILSERLSIIFFCLNDTIFRGSLVIECWCITGQPLEHEGDVRGHRSCTWNAKKERQRHNFTHVTTPTTQAWSDTFIR